MVEAVKASEAERQLGVRCKEPMPERTSQLDLTLQSEAVKISPNQELLLKPQMVAGQVSAHGWRMLKQMLLRMGIPATITQPVVGQSPGAGEPTQHQWCGSTTQYQAVQVDFGTTQVHLPGPGDGSTMELSISFIPLSAKRLSPQPYALCCWISSNPAANLAEPAQLRDTGSTTGVLQPTYPTAATGFRAATSKSDPPWMSILPRPGMGAVPVNANSGPAANTFPATWSLPAASHGSATGTCPAATTTAGPGPGPATSA